MHIESMIISARRSFAIILITLGVMILIIFSLKLWTFENLSGVNRLQWLWQSDLEELKSKGRLPKEFDLVREVEIQVSSEKTREWSKILTAPGRINPKGSYRLEVLLVDWNDAEDGEGALIQHNLVDIQSQNMIWELNRNYVIAEATKKTVAEANEGLHPKSDANHK